MDTDVVDTDSLVDTDVDTDTSDASDTGSDTSDTGSDTSDTDTDTDTDTGPVDVDGDGWTSDVDCDDADPLAWELTEWRVDCDGDGKRTFLSQCGAEQYVCPGTDPLLWYTNYLREDHHTDDDCDDGDPVRWVGSTEVPGDGIDQDCDGSDLPLAGVFLSPTGDDGGDGSRTAPVATLDRAFELAVSGGLPVLAAGGIYRRDPGPTPTGEVTVFGGYAPVSWAHDPEAHPTVVRGGSAGTVLFHADSTANTTTSFRDVAIETPGQAFGLEGGSLWMRRGRITAGEDAIHFQYGTTQLLFSSVASDARAIVTTNGMAIVRGGDVRGETTAFFSDLTGDGEFYNTSLSGGVYGVWILGTGIEVYCSTLQSPAERGTHAVYWPDRSTGYLIGNTIWGGADGALLFDGVYRVYAGNNAIFSEGPALVSTAGTDIWITDNEVNCDGSSSVASFTCVSVVGAVKPRIYGNTIRGGAAGDESIGLYLSKSAGQMGQNAVVPGPAPTRVAFRLDDDIGASRQTQVLHHSLHAEGGVALDLVGGAHAIVYGNILSGDTPLRAGADAVLSTVTWNLFARSSAACVAEVDGSCLDEAATNDCAAWGGSCVTAAENRVGDPDFVDASDGDLHLGPASEAVEARTAADEFFGGDEWERDIDYELRRLDPPHDLGADQR